MKTRCRRGSCRSSSGRPGLGPLLSIDHLGSYTGRIPEDPKPGVEASEWMEGRRPDSQAIRGGGPMSQPADWALAANVPAGRTFIKLLRRAIDRIIDELEH